MRVTSPKRTYLDLHLGTPLKFPFGDFKHARKDRRNVFNIFDIYMSN